MSNFGCDKFILSYIAMQRDFMKQTYDYLFPLDWLKIPFLELWHHLKSKPKIPAYQFKGRR